MTKTAEIKTISEKEAQEIVDENGFWARAILEIVGKPKKHIEETLQILIKKISEDEKFKLITHTSEDAENIEGSEGLFSTFAELEFTTKDINELMNFVLDYTPASLEVIQPGEMKISANYMSNMLTELVGRLHLIDGEFKKVVAKQKLMSESFSIMTQNAIMIFLNLKPSTKEDISNAVGVAQDKIDPFLKKLIDSEKIQLKDNKYMLK